MGKTYFVYILASKRNGTLYVGVTDKLAERIWQHKEGVADSFTKKNNVKILVYVESYPTPQEAIHREKCIKRWKRDWKIELIEGLNPRWDDLYDSLQS
ncbi:MAG: GIY-YIG nuclease family protein [Alphaproteobacteria bacterium]|nr:MAG: GIY-YIG nuclease family protein [Alphaproteobacteria bacterium]